MRDREGGQVGRKGGGIKNNLKETKGDTHTYGRPPGEAKGGSGHVAGVCVPPLVASWIPGGYGRVCA